MSISPKRTGWLKRMNQEARAHEKHGTAATASAVSAFLAWYADHAEEVAMVTGSLHKPYDTHVTVKEILDQGLRELQAAVDYFDHVEHAGEEYEKSEKDALWEGQ